MDTYIIRPWEQRYIGEHRKPRKTHIIRRAALLIGGMILTSIVTRGW